MTTFYLAVFVIGFALTVITFITGFAGHTVGHHGGVDAGGHAADGGHGHGDSGQRMPVLNFGTVTAFMTWFGGIGYLVSTYSHLVLLATVLMAMVGGTIGAGIIFVFMAKILTPDQIPLNPADYYLPGTLGRVTVTIPSHGTGEVVYSQAGTRKSVAARAADGASIVKGTEVVVLRYEGGIAYARPWDHLADERRASTRT